MLNQRESKSLHLCYLKKALDNFLIDLRILKFVIENYAISIKNSFQYLSSSILDYL